MLGFGVNLKVWILACVLMCAVLYGDNALSCLTSRSEVSKGCEFYTNNKSIFQKQIKKSDSNLQYCNSSNLMLCDLDSSLRASHFAENDESNADYFDSQDSLETTPESAQDLRESHKDSQDSHESTQDSRSIFAPAVISSDTYGAFAVGYQMLSKRNSLHARNRRHGAFFALDRGWSFVDNALLFGLALDGSAGEFYTINLGAKLGYRALSGRIIPSVAFSYGLINHKTGDSQHNFHGATATLSLFTDIASGLGLEVAYRVGLHPFPTLKKTNEKARIHSFMVNLRFVDFGI